MEKFEGEKLKKKKEAEIQSPEFELKEFEDTKEQFTNLIRQLTPAIHSQEYGLVIGDDASARLPTLVIGGLMKEIYNEDKKRSPQILFLAGEGWRDKDEKAELDRYLQKMIKGKKINPEETKVLLVTEYIQSGRHVANFLGSFKKVGLSCDVATLSTSSSSKSYKELPDFKDVKMYIGEPGGILRFWGQAGLSGVTKKDRKTFAGRSVFRGVFFYQAREDAKKMVGYLKQIYDREKEKIEK